MNAILKVLLDTCVLYPTVLREVLLHCAAQGLFQPLWSDRILGEWYRAAEKLGPLGQLQAQSDIALAKQRFPNATLHNYEHLQSRLYLPDPADIHVLAAAIAGSADLIITFNAKDFPRHTLAEEGLKRLDPDQFLYGLWQTNPDKIAAAIAQVMAQAAQIDGTPPNPRALLKKAHLPRLAKTISA